MNDHKELMTAIEAYYGPYQNDIQKQVVYKYVVRKFAFDQLENVFSKLTLKFSNKFKTPPDPAVFEDIFGNDENDEIEIQANEIWHEVNRKANAYADLIFADSCAFLAFRNATGGLVNFSQRTREEEVWIKKRFIELYKLYVKNSPRDEVRPILRGLSNGNGNGSRPVTIGDEKKCMQIADNNTDGFLVHELTQKIKRIKEG